MKRYILMVLCCVATMMTYAQYADCIEVNEFSPTISRWGADYQPVPTELECWEIDLGVQGHAKITYNIDLELVEALDLVKVYEIDANGNAIALRSFSACSAIGSLITNSTTGKVKIEYWGYYGNCGGIYNGFQIRVEQATCCDLVNHDHYILGKLGVGTTQPQEMLHVNGAIRGGGANGEVTLKGDNGSVTIGATDAQTMTFNTDKSKFVFNKSIISQSGVYGSCDSTNMQFKIDNSTKMIIQPNGNVGIGLTTPYARLHIYGGALRLGVGTSEAGRAANVLEFGDNSYVKIGEWQKDNTLSFKAHSYSFTVGNVGIGTLSPSYKLDVAGTIRAQELIVETTGADFVFAEDYNLRPLSEVKAFITENKHLPEIKSAQEMQENGVSISELQTQLLQKIEELTLYLIQQEQTIQELRQEVEQLKK